MGVMYTSGDLIISVCAHPPPPSFRLRATRKGCTRRGEWCNSKSAPEYGTTECLSRRPLSAVFKINIINLHLCAAVQRSGVQSSPPSPPSPSPPRALHANGSPPARHTRRSVQSSCCKTRKNYERDCFKQRSLCVGIWTSRQAYRGHRRAAK